MTGVAAPIALAVMLIAPSLARAEGPGIKLGDRLLLHLGLGAEVRYDNNIFFQSSGTENGGFIFRLLPSVDLATRMARMGGAPQTFDFRLHFGLAYNEFLTSNPAIAQHRSVGVNAGILFTLFPTGKFSLTLFDNYARTTQPPYSLLPYNLDRDTNELGARFRFAPGGGRLTTDFTYIFGLDFFEVPQLRDFNLLYHKLDLRVAWKFFPKTALFLNVNETIYTYQNRVNFNHSDSYPLRILLGVTGLITAKLSANVYVGYGNGFYATGPTPNTAIGGVNLTWKPTILSTGSIGYKFDFANSLVGSYYDLHLVYISWTQLIWRFTAAARLQYQHINYQGITSISALVPATATDRNDNYIGLDLRLDYPFKNWLIASLGYNLQWNKSDRQLNLGMGVPPAPVDYTKHEVWLRLAVLY